MKVFLGKALAGGTSLFRELDQKVESQAKQDAETWGQRTHELIAAAYGDEEAALFLDNSEYVFYMTPGSNEEKNIIRKRIDGRMRRITELLRRTVSLTVKDEFNPTQFD